MNLYPALSLPFRLFKNICMKLSSRDIETFYKYTASQNIRICAPPQRAPTFQENWEVSTLVPISSNSEILVVILLLVLPAIMISYHKSEVISPIHQSLHCS